MLGLKLNHVSKRGPWCLNFCRGDFHWQTFLIIQIWRKFGFAVMHLLDIRLLQIFAHHTTAQLLCHMQNFLLILSLVLGLIQNKSFHRSLILVKKIEWNVPGLSSSFFSDLVRSMEHCLSKSDNKWYRIWIHTYFPSNKISNDSGEGDSGGGGGVWRWCGGGVHCKGRDKKCYSLLWLANVGRGTHHINLPWIYILKTYLQGPLLLTWFNFNPSMDK